MAKKKTAPRRVPHTGTPRTYGDGMPSQAGQATAEAPTNGGVTSGSPAAAQATPRVPAAAPSRRGLSTGPSGLTRSQVPLEQEYSYVPKDLRQLGIIAVVTFAIMIVLGLLM